MLRQVACLLLVFAFLVTTTTSYSATSTLPSGTSFRVELAKSTSSEDTNNPNFVVAHDVVGSDNTVIIRRGTEVYTRVDRTPARRVGKSGSIEVSFLSVKTVNGQEISINGNVKESARSRKGMVLGVSLGLTFGSLLWLTPMLLFLLKKGDPAVIGSGEQVLVRTLSNAEIEIAE